jgi:hypothetical protein
MRIVAVNGNRTVDLRCGKSGGKSSLRVLTVRNEQPRTAQRSAAQRTVNKSTRASGAVNIEAERIVLAACLAHNRASEALGGKAVASHFSDLLHAQARDAMGCEVALENMQTLPRSSQQSMLLRRLRT